MGDSEDIKTLLTQVTEVIGKIDNIANEQHEIKKDIEKIDKKLESTADRTTRNEEKLKNLEVKFKEYKEENEKRHIRIYENMDKKETIIMNKVKVWALGGAISGIIVLIGFYINLKG